MAEYKVEVEFTVKREVDVYARDRQAAMEKAEDIVSGWSNVIDVEAIDAEEV